MSEKLSNTQVRDLIYAMGEMLFTPDGEKLEAATPEGQFALESALKALVPAASMIDRFAIRLVKTDTPEPEQDQA